MSTQLANYIVHHQKECVRMKYTTGLIILWPTLFELVSSLPGGQFVLRMLRPFFAVRILYCKQCGEMKVLNGTAELVLIVVEYFTEKVDDEGERVNARTMFLHDLTDMDKERLEILGAHEEGE